MAGMLPGVEAARRRRIYQGGGWPSSSSSPSSCWSSSCPSQPSLGLLSSPSSRRPSFLASSRRRSSRPEQGDGKLGQLAREAKERLDERLRAQRKSLLQRHDSGMSQETSEAERRGLRREVYGPKRKLIGWAKLWKTCEQQECAVCLEEFKAGENLLNLPCAHRFHSRCLLPWLHTSSHCPCCRISIFS